MSVWRDRAVPWLIEKACKSPEIKAERARWVPRARGDVLELGVGSGLNLAFYDPARVTRVTGVDPSAPLLARAGPRATSAGVPVELVRAGGEALPLDAGRFDAVLVTYSLCSVDDPVRVLAEVRRVLRPDGELIFVEHGRAPDPGPARVQRWLTPAWSRVSGGCRLDRDIAGVLRAARFTSDDLEIGYSSGPRWLSYTYQGTARPA